MTAKDTSLLIVLIRLARLPGWSKEKENIWKFRFPSGKCYFIRYSKNKKNAKLEVLDKERKPHKDHLRGYAAEGVHAILQKLTL